MDICIKPGVNLWTLVLCIAISLVAGCGGGGGGGGGAAAPAVSATNPSTNAANVSLNTTVTATFSEDMSGGTVTSTTFTLAPTASGTPIAGTVVSYDGPSRTATLTLPGPLAASTGFTATLTSGITNATGTSLAGDVAWTFTTGIVADITPPNFLSSTPGDGATTVSPGTTVTATFDETLNPATVNASTFTVTGSGAVSGTVTYNAATMTATFTPAATLQEQVLHTVTLRAGITDLAGNALSGAPVTFSFTTADTTAPMVSGRSPANSASSVILNASATATFSENMNPATISPTTFTLAATVGGASVTPASVSYDAVSRTATFVPAGTLSPNTGYTATVTTGAQDLSGNSLAAPEVWAFSTINDGTPPTVTLFNPASGEANVATNRIVTMTFDEDMDPASISASSFILAETVSGTPVTPLTVTYDAPSRTATFTPGANLTPNTAFTATATSAMTDVAGNPLGGAPVAWTFTTSSGPDTTPPFVGPFSPSDGDTDVSVSTHQVVSFSEPMDKASVQSALSVSPTPLNAPLYFWNAAGDMLTVVFDTQMPAGIHGNDILSEDTTHVVSVGPNARDLAGNPTGTTDTASWTTQSDITEPQISSMTPDIRTATATFSAGSTLTISFDEIMDTTVTFTGPARVSIESMSEEREASVGFPTTDLDVSWAGNDLVITFVTALDPNSVYEFELEGLGDLVGNRLREVDDELILVTAGSQTGNPTVMVAAPPEGSTSVAPDSQVFVAFSRPMAPGLESHFQITGAGSTQVDFERSVEPSGILVKPLQAWPALSLITVTIDGGPGGATDASGNTLQSNYSFFFTTGAQNTAAWGVSQDYSTLKAGDVDIAGQRLAHTFLFEDISGNRVFPNIQNSSPQDVTIREQVNGIPIKGYVIEIDEDGAAELWSEGRIESTPMLPGAVYELVFSTTSFTSSAGIPVSPTTIPFTIATGNTAPILYGVPRIEDVVTDSAGLSLQMELNLSDFDFGDVVTVSAQSGVNPGFAPSLTEPFPGNGYFVYETAGNDEPAITARSQMHTLTFTVSDGLGGHTRTIKRDIFPWDVADTPVPTAPTGISTGVPLYTFTLTATARAQADVVMIAVENLSTGKMALFTATGVPTGPTGSFQHPADNPLPSGTYILLVGVAKFDSGASLRGEFIGTAVGAATATFVVP